MDDEALLPPTVLAKATIINNEYAWPFADVEEAIVAAQALGLANLGGNPQFRLPDGIYDLYWAQRRQFGSSAGRGMACVCNAKCGRGS